MDYGTHGMNMSSKTSHAPKTRNIIVYSYIQNAISVRNNLRKI